MPAEVAQNRPPNQAAPVRHSARPSRSIDAHPVPAALVVHLLNVMARKWRHWSTGLPFGALAALGGAALARRRRRAALRGKVALVLGGSSGLGRWVARALADAGCRLVIAARDERELEDMHLELNANGAEVLSRRCDVGDHAQIDALIAAARERFGAIDVVVNVAGLIQVGPVDSLTPDDFRDAMAVNFWGPLHVIEAVLPEMRARRSGHIVNVTSIGGLIPMPHLLPYDCAKAAAVALSQGMGAELRKDGISVTTVIPGLMRTGSVPHVRFRGRPSAERRWFGAASTSRLTAMSPERAARRIVAAASRGDAQLVLTWEAKAGRIAFALLPSLTRRLLAAVNRLLPEAPPRRLAGP
jgi:NAD(P)-dependent dehydrogenase (short-subunit alcohol dehydrogenase family)